MRDRPNPPSTVKFSKLLDCMASKAFYILTNISFYADFVKHVILLVLSFDKYRSPSMVYG